MAHHGNNVTTAVLVVRDVKYKIPYQFIQKVFGQKLQQFYVSVTNNGEEATYEISRPLAAFEAIVDYCYCGKLHFPLSLCPGVFRDELQFWDIPINLMEKCCYHRYTTFLREEENIIGFENMCNKMEGDEIITGQTLDNNLSPKRKLWNVLDYRDDTAAGKLYFYVSTMMIMVAILNFVVATIPLTKPNPETKCPFNRSFVNGNCSGSVTDDSAKDDKRSPISLIETHVFIDCTDCFEIPTSHNMYVWFSNFDILPHTATIMYSMFNCCQIIERKVSLEMKQNFEPNSVRKRRSNDNGHDLKFQDNVTDVIKEFIQNQSTLPVLPVKDSMIPRIIADLKTSTHQRIKQITQIFHHQVPAVVYVEYTTTIFFAFELILRILTCPNRHLYFRRVLNLVDLILVIAGLGRVFVINFFALFRNATLLNVLLYISMFRVLRLFRVVENVTAFKVLIFSLRIGKKDLLVLFMYLLTAMFIFSNFIFIFENEIDFPSIPDAWWWSIVTMTTVGYGDMYPKTLIGKVIGCVCAITGVIMISLVIPVFVATFLFIYGYADRYKKYRRKTNMCKKYTLDCLRDISEIECEGKISSVELEDKRTWNLSVNTIKTADTFTTSM